MRTFIALEPPAAFSTDIAALARRLKSAVEGRFAASEGYHLTLAFLGDIDGRQAASAITALETAVAAAATAPLPLRSDGLGKFGRASDATLWLGIAPDPALMRFGKQLRDELAKRDLPFDGKSFKPHITLARRARLPKTELPPLPFPANAHAAAATLFKSTLARDGATYKPLFSIDLPTS